MEDIEELCDRIIILQKGKIVYDGDKQAIYDNYSKDEILKIQFQLKNDYKRALNDAILQVFICGQKESDFQIFFKTISVDKSKIISHLFNHYQVKDINLMQTDLGDIIAKLMTDKY